MITRTISAIATALLVGMLGACKESNTPQTPKSSPNNTYPAPAPLPPAAADLGPDTIPIRTPDGALARYGVESGRITMHYSGGLSGIRTIEFDHWGMRERVTDSSQVAPGGNPQMNRNILQINTSEKFIRADRHIKTYQERPNPNVAQFIAEDALKKKSFGREVLEKGLSKSPIGDTLISGYKSQVYSIRNQSIEETIYIWRGISLKERVSLLNDSLKFSVDAVEITLGVHLDDTMFAIPKGYKEAEPMPQQGAPGTVSPPKGANGQPMPGQAQPGQAPPQGQMPPGQAPPGGAPQGQAAPPVNSGKQ